MEINWLVVAMITGAAFILRPRLMIGACSTALRVVVSLVADVFALLLAWI
jgi:hypothetical protein